MAQSHTIARLTLDIRTGSLGDVWGVQEEVSRLIWQQGVAEMEALFDQLVSSDEVVRLDRVEIELQPLEANFLATDFIPALLRALQQALNDHLAGYHPANVEASKERSDRPSADWEIWLYFLRYGRLPWWGQSETWEGWLSRWQTALQSNRGWHTPFRELLARSASAQNRLLVQLPEAFRHQLILLLQPTWIGWRSLLSEAQQLMQGLSLSRPALQRLEHQAWALLFTYISRTQPTSPFPTTTWIQQWLPLLVQQWLSEGAIGLLDSLNGEDLPAQGPSIDDGEGDRPHPQPINATIQQPWVHATLEAHWQTLILQWISTDRSTWTAALPGAIATQNTAHLSNPPPPLASQPISQPPPLHDNVESSPSRPEIPLGRQDGAIALAPDEDATGIYLNQAGLVLLHPFLNAYFEKTGLVVEGQFHDETCQHRAIYLLHYLATRQTTPPEYELVLPKFLCGLPLDAVAPCPDLPDTALAEAEHLLQTVIHYWDALKRTSPDGLREGFLQRQGKLLRTGDSTWKLQVEQQSIDILLSRLPWGISMVKLPWMDDLLTVEWT